MPTPSQAHVLMLVWRDTGHPEGGGSEVYAEQVADGLSSRGYHVTYLTAAYPGAPAAQTRASGVRVVRRGGRIGVYAAAAWAVRRGTVAAPDIIVETQNGVPYLARLWAPRTPGIVLVHHVHREQWGVVFGPLLARIGWWVESRLAPWVNRARRYVAVSQVTRGELVGLGVDAARIEVIHNGTIPPPAADGRRSPTPLLLVMGRLVPHKRIEIAIEVLDRLRTRFPTLRLAIVGRGWWADVVRQEVQRRELSDRVDLPGYVSDAERHAWYARAWLNLVPSIKEGWGLVVVEAARHATPTVAFDGTGGVTESIIHGQTGILAGADDIDDFTAVVAGLLTDRSARDRLGDRAREHATRFTWQSTVDAWDTLIRSELDRSSTGPPA